jgi:hypothetical protein
MICSVNALVRGVTGVAFAAMSTHHPRRLLPFFSPFEPFEFKSRHPALGIGDQMAGAGAAGWSVCGRSPLPAPLFFPTFSSFEFNSAFAFPPRFRVGGLRARGPRLRGGGTGTRGTLCQGQGKPCHRESKQCHRKRRVCRRCSTLCQGRHKACQRRRNVCHQSSTVCRARSIAGRWNAHMLRDEGLGGPCGRSETALLCGGGARISELLTRSRKLRRASLDDMGGVGQPRGLSKAGLYE